MAEIFEKHYLLENESFIEIEEELFCFLAFITYNNKVQEIKFKNIKMMKDAIAFR